MSCLSIPLMMAADHDPTRARETHKENENEQHIITVCTIHGIVAYFYTINLSITESTSDIIISCVQLSH